VRDPSLSVHHPINASRPPAISENRVVAGLAALGILMFVFPVLTITVPIAGTRSQTGYDMLVGASPLPSTLTSQPRETPSPGASKDQGSRLPDFPLSIRLAPLLPYFVLAAFLGAVATMFWVFSFPKASSVVSAVGAFSGLLAIVHISVLNSDMHRFLEAQLATLRGDDRGQPFAGLAEGLAHLAVGGMNFSPGSGLYVLTACLAMGFFFLKTHLLGRIAIRRT